MNFHPQKIAGLFIAAAAFAALPVAAQQPEPEPQPQDFQQVLRDNHIDPSVAQGLKHKNIEVVIQPLSPHPYENESYTPGSYIPQGPGDRCRIYVANPAFTRADLIYKYTSIPRSHIRDFGNAADLTFPRLLLHEATHCGQYGDPDTSLAHETEADLTAVNALASQPGGILNAIVFRHVRAVFACIHPTAHTHAMAGALYAQEMGLPQPDPVAVDAAQERVHQMFVSAGIFADYEHWIDHDLGEQRLTRMYSIFSDGLRQGRFDGDPAVKDIAQRFVEGIDYLAPGWLSPAPAQTFAPQRPVP